MTSKIQGKLQDHAYRTAFVASQINVGIPFQIKALMKTRGWTQEQLAERTGMLQPRISAVLKPGKVRPNIETLRRFAEAFDCGLLVRFAPFSELARWSDSFDPERFNAPAFEDDLGFKESEKAVAVKTQAAGMTGLANATLQDLDFFQQVQDFQSRVVEAVRNYAPQNLTGLSLQVLAGYENANGPGATLNEYLETNPASQQAPPEAQIPDRYGDLKGADEEAFWNKGPTKKATYRKKRSPRRRSSAQRTLKQAA